MFAQPFFGDLLGFIGAIATGPTTFWLPPLMWIILYRPSLTDVRPSFLFLDLTTENAQQYDRLA